VTAARASRTIEPGEATDAQLLARLKGGEVGALGQLFDRHADAVRRVVARLGVRPADVDDLVQTTFLDVLDAAASYDGRASARPWLVGMAVMRVRRHRRSLSRLAARLAAWSREPEPETPTPEASVEGRERARRAEAALAALSQKKREVFVLVALEGLPGDEVARTLGIPVATVWTRLHHARLELREALAREER
jgi:RNA polymerase sigma-70 factor (ECF subfamily)